MNYIDCEVIDCKNQVNGECECIHVEINKVGVCKSYISLGNHYKWEKYTGGELNKQGY
jgi:hypothetical protein